MTSRVQTMFPATVFFFAAVFNCASGNRSVQAKSENHLGGADLCWTLVSVKDKGVHGWLALKYNGEGPFNCRG